MPFPLLLNLLGSLISQQGQQAQQAGANAPVSNNPANSDFMGPQQRPGFGQQMGGLLSGLIAQGAQRAPATGSPGMMDPMMQQIMQMQMQRMM